MKVRTMKRRRTIPWRVIGISIAAAAIMSVTGYFFAVRVLFPPLPEPKNGIVVPALTGLSLAAAERTLNSIGLRVSDVVELAHPSQPPGIIIAQSPLAGQQLRIAGAVRLGISSGAPRAEAQIPAPVPLPAADSTATTPDTLRVAPDTLH